MNRQKKQVTLFQTWSSGPPTTSRKTTASNLGEIDLTEDEEPTEEDLLFSKALDDSLAEYNAAQASTSTAQQTIHSSTPLETLPGFDNEAGKTWIYPTNYPIREYQFSMVQKALFKNTIIILPTGLGKTFIAAVVMYNYFRWYPRGKIIFMAPTKPLVAQQIEACFNIMGIPLEDSAEMTGAMSPEKRQQTWQDKRVFFITPQVMNNDLARGICPAEAVKLLVFDEAHKATKNYAYCLVVNEVVKYSTQFRVLALTATPGSDPVTVQQVFQNLLIACVESRTEDSIDIKPYTFDRKIQTVVVPMNDELKRFIDDVLSVLAVYIDRLKKHNLLYCHNVASVKQFQLIESRNQFRQNSSKNMSKSLSGSIESCYSTAITISHAYEMLIIYGIRTFYNFIQEHFDGLKGFPLSRCELMRNVTLTDIVAELRTKFDPENYDVGFISHPKLPMTEQLIKEHFTNFETKIGEQPNTRVMIFSAYRSSVEEITNILNKNRPLIRAMAFTGQANSSSSKGITQKEQIEIIKQFRQGGYNTLVATSVGEEGLDIGNVDLIICFDVYKSPIRLIQRMGRTGRKREGRVVMLTSEGREENVYNLSKSKAATVQKWINKENFHAPYAQNPRMVPKGLNPRCHKMHFTVTAYQRTTGRKKKNTAEASGDGITKFLNRHSRNKDTEENETEDGSEITNEEKAKCGTVRKLKEKTNDVNVNQKPCRISKKQKKALILDDSDEPNDEMTNSKESEPEKRKESESDDRKESESENINENEENFGFENDYEMDEGAELCFAEDFNVTSKNDDDFFPGTTVNPNAAVSRGRSIVRSPPNFNCVFSKRKEELSPIAYERILNNEQTDKIFAETASFGMKDRDLSPVMNFDLPVSPIITSFVRNSRIDEEMDGFEVDVPLSKSVQNRSTYSVTQLIDMVHEDSVKIKTPENFTKLKRKTDGEIEDKVEIKKVVPNFDLKFNFSFDDNSQDDVIPSSQNNIKTPVKKDKIPTVSFDMKIQEFFNDSVNEIDSSLDAIDDVNEKTIRPCVTSTPKFVKAVKAPENNDSSFDWENLPRPKCVKFSNVKKKPRKRKLVDKFVESQALVTNVISSDEESESDLDIIESSFIDDNTLAVEHSMTAVYLKSVKDNIGPQQFKIKPLDDKNRVEMTQFTQDEYEEDSFCVANDNVEFAQSPEKEKKKWKRIANNNDYTSTSTVTVSEPLTKDNSNNETEGNLLVLIDSKEINGCHQLISELRHQYKVQSHVVSLNSCNYIVSTRMGVERKLFSSVSNIGLKNRLVESITSMSYLFDRTCLIIETDREKLGTKPNSSRMYYNRLISALLQLPIKVLHSDSQAHSAFLLRELALDEKKKGFGLPVDCTLPLSKKDEQTVRLYQRIPVVNYLTALNLCRNMLSVQQFVNSSASVIQRKGCTNEARANEIVNFVKHNFNSS